MDNDKIDGDGKMRKESTPHNMEENDGVSKSKSNAAQEKLFERFRKKIRSAMGSMTRSQGALSIKNDVSNAFRHLKPRKIMVIGIISFFTIYIATGVYLVNPGEQAVERMFGKMVRDGIGEGIHYRLPWPFQRVDIVNVSEIRRESVGMNHQEHAGLHLVPDKIQVLTGDENIVEAQLIIQYKISDPALYLFKGDYQPFQLVNEAVRYSVTQVSGSMRVDDILTVGKEELQRRVMNGAQKILDDYQSGLTIVNVNLNKMYPPDELAEAFKDVASAREDKLREISQAESYRNGLLPPAKGQAEGQIRSAEAYAIDVANRAQGEAQRFIKTLVEFRASVAKSGTDVTNERLYLETMERVLPKTKRYFIDGSGGKFNLRITEPNL
ncbi:MAG: FtsH protease activity modulator HflK [Rectinemataceae bacterium]|nr:FtsH protease activity modulator HflK [Rectinemataceae bacterium]